MKRFFIITTLCYFAQIAFAQDMPHALTPEDTKRLKADIEKEVPAFKKRLSQDFSADAIEFYCDTFRIEQLCKRSLDIDYSTAGMNQCVDELTNGYDKLMNKYYNKLLKKLSEKDKKVLISTQKTWLAFRDAETNFIGTMTQEKYSGGGTMQSNISTALYSQLVVTRANQIFNHFDGMVR